MKVRGQLEIVAAFLSLYVFTWFNKNDSPFFLVPGFDDSKDASVLVSAKRPLDRSRFRAKSKRTTPAPEVCWLSPKEGGDLERSPRTFVWSSCNPTNHPDWEVRRKCQTSNHIVTIQGKEAKQE